MIYCCHMHRTAKHKGDSMMWENFSHLLQAVHFRLTENFLAWLLRGGINFSPCCHEAWGVSERNGSQAVPKQPETPEAPAVGQKPARRAAVVPAVPVPGIRWGCEYKAFTGWWGFEWAAVSADAQPRGHPGRSCPAFVHRWWQFLFLN